jgi:diketogulonate reductase-like aldo/keto reductase
MSLRRLGVERIDLWQLHHVDPLYSREEQYQAVAEMQKARPQSPSLIAVLQRQPLLR